MAEKNIEMIALDLDRTTLSDSRTMPEENIEALEEAGRKGVTVVIATGRVFDALPECVFGLSSVKYFICSNGASIVDANTKEILYEKCLDPEAVETMVGLVREKGYMFESFTEGRAYMGKSYYDQVINGELMYRTRRYVEDTRRPVEDIFQFTLDHKDRIENMNVFFPDQEKKEEMRPLLAAIPHSVLTSSFPSNLELGGEGVSKGNALTRVLEMTGIRKENLMAAGDSPNDLTMLELAGVPVAVENAEDVVKEACCYIAPSAAEAGVADAVKRFVL